MAAQADLETARQVTDEGFRAAAQVGHPLMRARHQAAWLFRLSAVDPEAASAREAELADDPVQRAQLVITAAADRLHRGEGELEPQFSRAIELASGLDPDARLRVLNSLSELAIELGDRDREAAVSLLGKLIPAVRTGDDSLEARQQRVLGSALIGEALMVLDDPRGLELLSQAEAESADLAGRDPVTLFLASAFSRRDPRRALRLVETVLDPGARLESSLPLLGQVPDAEVRRELLELILPDARQVAHWRGPEALVLLGQAVAAFDPERARPLFEEALHGAEGNPPQVRALQATGVATVLAGVDREWAAALFDEAVRTAGEEEERVKRVTTRALIAGEMAEAFPRAAAAVLEGVIAESLELEAMWEYAHLMDVLFRPDRSPYLDLSGARPLLERLLEFVSDEDPRIPGVLGLPEVARAMLEIAPERGRELFWRWYRAAEKAGDSDGMSQAAAALHRADPAAGREALKQAHDLLIQRVDCPSMGDFCRRAAPLEPDLVLSMAPHIPDRRERSEAHVEAAVGRFEQDRAAGLALAQQIEDPANRSLALLRIADHLLGTGDRPEPQPLLEDLP